jgi:thymidylate kinase
LIVDFFEHLEKEHILYVVLRNYEGLPKIIGHDIDLLVDELRIADIKNIFLTIAEKNHWIIIQKANRLGFLSFTLIPPLPHKKCDKAVKFDVWAPMLWRGLPWIACDDMLKSRIKHDQGFFIPEKGAEAATLLLKDLIQAGKIRPKYFDRIQQLCLENPDAFKKALVQIFGEICVSWLLLSVEQKNWGKIEHNYKKIRLIIIRSALKNHPFETTGNSFRFLSGHLFDYLNGKKTRSRIFLCLIGPDGSGKSTIATGITVSMSDTFENVHYFHGHYNILPSLNTIVPQKIAINGEKQLLKKESSIIKKIIAVSLISYYSIDYLLGYYLCTPKRNQGDLIIFDRYFFDYMIQPGPISFHSYFFRIIGLLIPKPDIIIYPFAPPEVIFQRKPELTIDEIKHQSEICEKLVSILPHTYHVDNAGSLDSVILEIHNLIIKRIISKTEGKYE